jgi:hypothetical protein
MTIISMDAVACLVFQLVFNKQRLHVAVVLKNLRSEGRSMHKVEQAKGAFTSP